MKGYWIILGGDVTDTAAREEYVRRWGPIAERYGARINQTAATPELVEPNGASRVLIVEFASLADARACYADPDYQEAMTYAVKASTRSLLMVEGEL